MGSVPGTDAPSDVEADTSRVNRSDLDRLPKAYRIGLQLRDLGADMDLIAECLGIPVGGVNALLAIGERKLVQAERAGCENPKEKEG
jgi:DNA-directed RNA polymerase specialized sigma24 family protein